jgi:transketolase
LEEVENPLGRRLDLMFQDKFLIELEERALAVRRSIVRMIYHGGSGHPGGSLSCTDILVALYFNLMNIDPNQPSMYDRDRFILSKAHCAPALYAVLAERGFFDKNLLNTFSTGGSILQKHIDMLLVPGADMSGGSLGQGLSVAVGMALAARLDQSNRHIYVCLGDGETNEGQVWEAAMAARHYKLGNVTAFLDRNRLQVDGGTESVMALEPLAAKWQAFGWNTIRINGHSFPAILGAVKALQSEPDIPGMVIADTVKGKGISFVEDKVEWHARSFTRDEAIIALDELGAGEESI